MPTHPFWNVIGPQRANEILCCVQDANKKLYRSTVDIIAPSMGMRYVKIMEMPKIERHTDFANFLSKPPVEALSFNIFSLWFISEHRDLLCTWLDALHIEHDEEGCTTSFPPAPEKAKLQKAIETLLSKFDAPLVSLYLNVFNEIDEVHWQPLAEILQSDSRLQPKS